MRRCLLLACLLLAVPATAGAQGGSKCGTLPRPEAYLNRLARYFVDPSHASVRTGKFEQVPADAPRSVITDDRTCNRVMHPVSRELRSRSDWQEMRRNGFDFRVFRYGTDYAVLVMENNPPGGTRLGYSNLYVLRSSDLAIVAKILV